MPKDRRPRPRPRAQMIDRNAQDTNTLNQMATELVERVNAVPLVERRSFLVDLAVGNNRLNHGLGGRARGASVAPTVADAAFAWAFVIDDDRSITIAVVGVAQPGAVVEVYR